MAAREDVLGHGQVREDGRLLVHRDDPEPVRRLRAADRCGSPVDEQLALVGLDDAGEDLHERRLAGAVLADERVHRPGVDPKLTSATAWTPP